MTAGISEDEAHARATSSITMHVASASAPDAAVLLRHVRGVEVGRHQRVVRLLREAGLLVDRGGVRRDLVVADVADGRADGLVLLGEGVEVAHGHEF